MSPFPTIGRGPPATSTWWWQAFVFLFSRFFSQVKIINRVHHSSAFLSFIFKTIYFPPLEIAKRITITQICAFKTAACWWSIHHSSLRARVFERKKCRQLRHKNALLLPLQEKRWWLCLIGAININQVAAQRQPHHSIYLFLTVKTMMKSLYYIRSSKVSRVVYIYDCYCELLLTFEMNQHICVRAIFPCNYIYVEDLRVMGRITSRPDRIHTAHIIKYTMCIVAYIHIYASESQQPTYSRQMGKSIWAVPFNNKQQQQQKLSLPMLFSYDGEETMRPLAGSRHKSDKNSVRGICMVYC